MKYDQLKSCAESLKTIRSQLHRDLDPGISAELDSVISRLENGWKESGKKEKRSTKKALDDGLAVLARIVEVSTNIFDLIFRFWN
jgi:hypothetical protein